MPNDEGFRALADNMPNLAWMADKDGWIYWYNTQWYDYTGTKPKDMEGWGWQSVHDPAQLPQVLSRWQSSIASGELFEMVFPLKAANGKFRPFLTRVVPIKNNQEIIYQWFGTNTDVTEQILDREKAEQLAVQQQQAASELASVLESMGDAFFMLDKDWNIIRVNKNYETLSQLKRADCIGKNFWKLFPATDITDSASWIQYHKAVRTKKPGHFIERYGPLDRWIEVDVYPTKDGGVSVFFRDISERLEAERALVASEAKFRFMTESMPQQIWTATPDGRLDYVNLQAVKYFDKTAEEVMEGWQSAIHPDDLPRTVEAWTKALQTGQIYDTEFRLQRASDSSYRWHLVRALPMCGESGTILKWFGSNTDIQEIVSTTRRRDELEKITTILRKQHSELLALNKSKDEFISLASHQLRTPATGVKQYVGMLREGFAGDMSKEQQRFVERAYESNERQLKIVNDLLKVARVDAGKVKLRPASVLLVPLIQEIIDDLAREFEAKGQTANLASLDGQYAARADKDLLRTVLENLIDNARKYSPEGTAVTISLANKKEAVHIAVKDAGVGIAAADIAQLGQKFTRIDNPLSGHVEGTGLGLYWVKKVIGLHQGTLDIQSEPGYGSTFTVLLPKAQI